MKLASYIYTLLALTAGLQGCKPKPEPVPSETATLKIAFDNIVGNQNLVLNGFNYKNGAGEEFTITKFNYFVSNFKLFKADGSSYTIPQDSSYFLIREDLRESQRISLNNVPVGDYTGVEFVLGVDSLRNTADLSKRTGALDPGGSMAGDGMYWSWNSGYIFMKLEGASPVAAGIGKFYYHIGLFGGYSQRTVNNTKTIRINFGSEKATVSYSSVAEVHLFADVLKVFDGPHRISIEENNSIMGEQQAKSQQVANNYAHMFSLGEVHSH